MKRRVKHTQTASLLLVFVFLAFHPNPCTAQLKPVGDEVLASVEASSGVSVCIRDLSLDLALAGIQYTDTDTGNSIEFNNITFHDGSLGPVYFDTNDSPITLDLFTVDDLSSPINGQTLLSIVNQDWTQDLFVTVENLVFCNQDLGRLDVGLVDIPNSHLYMGVKHGVGFEFGMELNIDDFSYTYNTAPTSLTFHGIHLAENASGAPDAPGTWAFSGQFRLGDMFNNDPVKLDVITETASNTTHMILNMPMSGYVRIEDLDFGGEDFGPCAIDGITVHRLSVEIPAI